MKHKVEDHLKLVHKIAHRYSRRNRMEYDDIFQEGCIGLMRACDEYRESDVPFGAFAAMHIEFAIKSALYNSNIMHTPNYVINVASNIKKRDLLDEEPLKIAEQLNVPLAHVENALHHLKIDVMSLDYEKVGNKDGDKVTLLDKVGYEENFDDKIYIEQMLDVLNINELYKPIVLLMLDGYKITEVERMLGLNARTGNARRWNHLNRIKHKRDLIYK